MHFNILIDGRVTPAHAEQTIAAILVAAGQHTFRHTASGSPRGLFCGMGVCFDCLVTVNDRPNQRACMILAEPGMEIQTVPVQEGDHDQY